MIAVSVIIPVYNTEKYLEECLQSVVGQKAPDMEIICVNDGSTDSSGDILKKYEKADSRIRVICQENAGLSCARNTGILAARGEYLCFLDSDDILVEDSVAEMYQIASKNALEILTYDATCFYENDRLKKKEYKDEYYQRKKEYGGPKTGKELFCELIENNDFCDAAWILFVKKDWLRDEGILFKPKLIHEDCLFSFQCYMSVKRIMHIKKEYIKYRIRENSIMTSKAFAGSLIGRIVCYTEVLRYLLNENISEREANAISRFAEFIMYNIKYVDFALDDDERLKTRETDIITKLVANSMDVGEARQYSISPYIYQLGFDELVKSAKNIILYGAGKIGRMVYEYLCQRGLENKITFFAVTDAPDAKMYIGNAEVVGIEELAEDRSDLVIITARRDFQYDMKEKAKALGYSNIEVIDFRLEQIIAKTLEVEKNGY